MNRIVMRDTEIFSAIEAEKTRQIEKLELIASENNVSPAVLEATGSILTNKYAEGYPAKRYYGGCENIDVIETLAINRAKELFKCAAANVQPHSGSQANMAAYLALAGAGAKILGLDLSNGGHLTHGAKVNFSGFIYQSESYGVKDDGYLDYDDLFNKARTFKPNIIVAGFSAYPRFLDFAKFRQIADEVGAFLVADIAHVAGLVVAGLYPDPVPFCHLVTTTTHKTLRGPRGGLILGSEELIKKVNSKIFPGIQGGPLCHVIAAKAISFHEALDSSFKSYAQMIVKNAKQLASSLMAFGFKLSTNGTDNHLMLIDLTNKGITGKDAENILDQAGITVNKNTVPGEKLSPFVTSGIRLGTAALTTRGLTEKDIVQVASFIDKAINTGLNSPQLAIIKKDVAEFARKFPLFQY